MTDNPNHAGPVVIGAVAVDVICYWDDIGKSFVPQLRFGGVCHNAACVLGNLGLSPSFVSVRFTEDLGKGVAPHLSRNGVRWLPIDENAPLSIFHVDVDADGTVRNEVFTDRGASAALESNVVRCHLNELDDATLVLANTDLPLETLDTLQAMVNLRHGELWIISSSVEEAWKLSALAARPTSIGLNLDELEAVAGRTLKTVEDTVDVARSLVAADGVCAVTLGSTGALLSVGASNAFYYEKAGTLRGPLSPVGAGDVLYACVLAAHLRGRDWASSLRYGVAGAATYVAQGHDVPEPYQYLSTIDDQKPPASGLAQ
jgi:sugar/nucleoside kinase (ribokinase family)